MATYTVTCNGNTQWEDGGKVITAVKCTKDPVVVRKFSIFVGKDRDEMGYEQDMKLEKLRAQASESGNLHSTCKSFNPSIV